MNIQERKKIVVIYHRSDFDGIFCYQIAKRYGGGGHKGACGFELEQFPHTLWVEVEKWVEANIQR
jgi:nanoRNase/pAp phosphatase (c-di-AMP/oligoRNAs hydrolase)